MVLIAAPIWQITDMAIAPVSGDVEKSAAETSTVTG